MLVGRFDTCDQFTIRMSYQFTYLCNGMIMIGIFAQCREHVGTCGHVDKCEIGVVLLLFVVGYLCLNSVQHDIWMVNI